MYRRHLAEEGISPDDNLLEYLEMVQDGAIHGLLQELEDEEKSLGRNLQGSELLETLTVTFIRCIFEVSWKCLLSSISFNLCVAFLT